MSDAYVCMHKHVRLGGLEPGEGMLPHAGNYFKNSRCPEIFSACEAILGQN